MANAHDATRELLSSSDVSNEAARHDDPLSPAGVRLAAATKRLKVAAVTPRGQRLFSRVDVEAFLRERARRRRAVAP